MSCKKHPHRKRKDCPDCFPPVKIDMPAKISKAKIVASKPEKTSREMLAELSSMEKEVDEMVIKAPRQKREKKPEPEKKEELVLPESNVVGAEPIDTDPLAEFRKTVSDIIEKNIAEFQKKIRALSEIRHEWLDVAEGAVTVKLLDILHNDGWRLVNFYKGDCAKVSGFKGNVALFDRICSEKWKKTAKQWKENLGEK